MTYYLDSKQITFSALDYENYFRISNPDKIIKFNWICPEWLKCDSYNFSTSVFTFNITDINNSLFEYGIIKYMKLQYGLDNYHSNQVPFFFILNNEMSIKSKMAFNISFPNGNPTIKLTFPMYYEFINLNYDFENYFKILWSVDNSNKITYFSDNSSRLFLISINNYGNLTIFCNISHINSLVYNVVSKAIYIPYPPVNGTCNVYPNSGMIGKDIFTFQALGWKVNSTSNDIISYEYGYLDDNQNFNLFPSNSTDMTSHFTTVINFDISAVYCRIYSNNNTYSEVQNNITIYNNNSNPIIVNYGDLNNLTNFINVKLYLI